MSSTDILLADIEAFIARSGMTPTEFGLKALNNPAFLIHLRSGGDVRLRTADKVRAFMTDHDRGRRQKKANHSSVAA